MRERVRIVREAAEEAGRPMPTVSARLSVDFSGTREGPAMISGSAE